jgi:hypothetical protein
MNHQEVFSECVRKHFSYLLDEFGFSIVEDQYHQNSSACVVAFQNKSRYAKLVWELRDGLFYFYVYRVLSNGKPAPYNDHGTDQFILFTLAKYYEPQIDIEAIMEMNYYNPDLRVLDEKIGANAKLLQKYGQEILKGNEWFDGLKKEIVPNPT